MFCYSVCAIINSDKMYGHFTGGTEAPAHALQHERSTSVLIHKVESE